MIRRIAGAVLDLLYPRHCTGCGVRLEGPTRACLCDVCLAGAVRADVSSCPRCAEPVGPHSDGRGACPRADRHPALAFEAATAVYRYEGPIREVIHALKFQGDLTPVEWVSREVSDAVGRAPWARRVEVVVPVPLHWTRRLRRRFNQSELIARYVARAHGWPLAARAVVRTRITGPQSSLGPAEREANVRGAFRVARPGPVRGRAVLLVDDVMSSCATASECARAIRAAGARYVFVAVFAR